MIYLFVVPEHSSDEMRHLIQALLIVHAEPKLNITIDKNNDCTLKSNACHNIWCQNLIHPRLRSSLLP